MIVRVLWVLTISIFYFLAFGFLYHSQNEFMINSDISNIIEPYSTISIFFIAFFAVMTFRAAVFGGEGGISFIRTLLYSGSCAALVAAGNPAWLHGGVIAFTSRISENHSIEFVSMRVVELGRMSGGSLSCDYQLRLANDDLGSTTGTLFCGADYELFAGLKVGNFVQLAGYQGKFGFRPTSISR